MKTMVILRGPPGSGKSLFCSFMKEFAADGHKPLVISLDMFRMVDGKYVFDPAREKEVVSEYHVAVIQACQSGEQFIILDNVHSRFWEFERTKKMGERHGYRIFVIEVQADFWTCLDRMVHPVPFDKLKEIFARWETWLRWTIPTRLDGVELLLSRLLKKGK